MRYERFQSPQELKWAELDESFDRLMEFLCKECDLGFLT